jgi:hypothetical protein
MVVDSGIAMREYGKTLNDFATCAATSPRTQTTLRQLLLYFIRFPLQFFVNLIVPHAVLASAAKLRYLRENLADFGPRRYPS